MRVVNSKLWLQVGSRKLSSGKIQESFIRLLKYGKQIARLLYGPRVGAKKVLSRHFIKKVRAEVPSQWKKVCCKIRSHVAARSTYYPVFAGTPAWSRTELRRFCLLLNTTTRADVASARV